jgi:ABC-type multidrug transport system fused ATPase/permease subunit
VTLTEGARVLWTGIRAEPAVFAASMVGSALFGLATVWSAAVVGRVTEEVIAPAFAAGETTRAALLSAVWLLVGVATVKALSIALRRYFAGVMQFRLQARTRRRVTRQYLRLPLRWHQQHPTGELLSNANSDVEATWAPIAPMPMAFGVVVMLGVAVVSMLGADPVLGGVGLLVFPAVVVVNVVYQRRLGPLAGRAQALRAEVSAIAHESFDGALVVKSLGREQEETERFATSARHLRDVNAAVGRVRGLFDPVIEAIPTLGVLAVLALGTQRVASGAVAPGTVVEVAFLLTVVAFPVRAIGWLLGELPRSVIGSRRVDAVLDAEGHTEYGSVRLPDGPLGSQPPLDVTAEGLGFAYLPAVPVLENVDVLLAPGRVVALVGETGSGKSTLASLLVRLVDPTAGQVRLDAIPAPTLAPGEVPRATAIVLQQAFLFDDTIRGNVTLGLEEDGVVDDEDVWAALALAQATEFVTALPAGLDTRVGERGTSLSGGQRQRLALARALVRRPRFLILDDATSAVDPDVERRILDGLRQLRGTTVLVVAHRPATIALADEVLHLDARTVADQGPHVDLLARNAAYRDLVTAYEQDAAARAEVLR